MSFIEKFNRTIKVINLHRDFRKYFKIVPAFNDELKNEVYKLRYQVYCRELGWEPPNETLLEKDAYDDRSYHCLLQNINSEEFIGCIRIVVPDLRFPNAPLPFENVCAGSLDQGVPDLSMQLNNSIGEASRLAVIGKYRSRRREKNKSIHISKQDFEEQGHTRFPYIPVGLYMAMLHIARAKEIKKIYILTEPLLARHFNMLGGGLSSVGQPIEHRGIRQAFELDVDEVISGMKFLLRPLFDEIAKDVKKAL